MARLWSCGFELQSATAGVEFSETSTSAPTVSTSIKRLGNASMRFHPSATVQYVSHQFGSVAARHVYFRMYLYVATMPTVDTIIMSSCDSLGTGAGRSPRLFLQTNGTLRTSTGSGSAHGYVGGSSATLSTGQWYRVELDYDSVNDIQHAYLDGTDFSDAVDGVGFTAFEAAAIRVGAFTDTPAGSTSADLYIDDIAVNDSTGSVQNGLPGAGNIVHLLPNAAGDSNGFATVVGGTAGAANNYTRVNETTPNDATSYNATTATGTTTTDDFNLVSSASAGIGNTDTITLVQVGGRVGSSAATTASLVYRIKSQAAGTAAEGSSALVNINGWCTHTNNAVRPYQLTSYANPQAAGAWTPALLDTAQIGYRSNVSQATTRRISGLWALVDFVPNTVPPVTFTTVEDDFDDNTIDTTLWAGAAGVTETGGRARVPCTSAFPDYSTAAAYTLADSHLGCRMYPAAVAGASTECFTQVLITTSSPGTDVNIYNDAIAGTLVMAVRAAYADAGLTTIPYDPADHAWVRIRETAGTLYWETAPDGSTWTVRRTATSPAWVSDDDLAAHLLAHRAEGTGNFAEFDDVNLLPSGQTISLGRAGEDSAARPLARTKRRATGAARTVDGAKPVAKRKTSRLGPAPVADTARPLTHTRTLPVHAAHVADTAKPITARRTITLGVAHETASAGALTVVHTVALGTAREQSAARSLVSARTVHLGPVREQTTTGALTKGITVQLGVAREGARAPALTHARTLHLSSAVEVSAGRPITAAKTVPVGTARSAEGTHPLTWSRRVHLGAARTVEQAGPLSASGAQTLGTAATTDTGQPIAASKTAALTTAGTLDAAHPLAAAKTATLSPAGTTWRAGGLSPAKGRALAGGREGTRAGALTPSKAVVPGVAREQSAAREMDRQTAGGLGTARIAEVGLPVTPAKLVRLGAARAAETARPLQAGNVRPLSTARTRNHAGSIVPCKAARLGVTRARERATSFVGRSQTTLGTARTHDHAGSVRQPFQTRRLSTARVHDTAHPIGAVHQRPADRLAATTSGPLLTPSTRGPSLTVNARGPGLVATSTTGG